MALRDDFYRAIEATLGPDYVSRDPVVLDSYMPLKVPMETGSGKSERPRFEAIALPKSTEEVQAVVRLCNRFRVQYRASSTGWMYCDPPGPGVIKLDLRRMNKIVEINEKSMYAVVEPYVIYAQLQAELMKRGLNCNITGAGSNCSALPVAAHANLGHLSQSGSYGERNLLGLEWVTGDGEIVRLGSLGSTGEWFCGDGPGPSLRGIIRGNTVPLGGLGVFTRAAQKVYHWPGPPMFPIEGNSPRYTPSEMPANFMVRYISFVSRERMYEAVRLIGEAEIGFTLMGFNPAMMASNVATSNEEDVKYFKAFSDAVQGPGFLLIVAGNSQRDFEYKRGALEQIMDVTDGRALQQVEDPELAGGFLWRFIRITGSIRETSRAAGCNAGAVGATDVFPLMAEFIATLSKPKQEFIDRGLLLDDGTDVFVQSVEHGHLGHGEILIRYNPDHPGSKAVGGETLDIANRNAIRGCFGVPHHAWNDPVHDLFGPHASNYHVWLRRIKAAFDPNNASEGFNYITADGGGEGSASATQDEARK